MTRPFYYCLNCGSTQTLHDIKLEHPAALSCCPERDMVFREAHVDMLKAAHTKRQDELFEHNNAQLEENRQQRRAMTQLKRVCLENHAHHQNYDQTGTYDGSEMEEMNLAAINFDIRLLEYRTPEILIDRYEGMLREHTGDDVVECREDPGTEPAHLRWMLKQLRSPMEYGKANRWMGFIQDRIISLGLTDVTTERNFTRPIFSLKVLP